MQTIPIIYITLVFLFFVGLLATSHHFRTRWEFLNNYSICQLYRGCILMFNYIWVVGNRRSIIYLSAKKLSWFHWIWPISSTLFFPQSTLYDIQQFNWNLPHGWRYWNKFQTTSLSKETGGSLHDETISLKDSKNTRLKRLNQHSWLDGMSHNRWTATQNRQSRSKVSQDRTTRVSSNCQFSQAFWALTLWIHCSVWSITQRNSWIGKNRTFAEILLLWRSLWQK